MLIHGAGEQISEMQTYLYEISPMLHHRHRHNFFELIYVCHGQYAVNIEGEKRILHEHEVCLLDRNCLHTDINEECTGISFFLGIKINMIDEYFISAFPAGEWYDFILRDLKTKSTANYISQLLSDKDAQEVEMYYANIYEELLNAELGYQRVLQAYFMRLLKILNQSTSSRLSTHTIQNRSRVLFREISEYMQLHLADINLDMLVSEFHYQADYYNRLIKKYTGSTFSAYLQKLRIEKAKELLRATQMSVKDITVLLNYSSESYFYRQFRKAVKMTPQEFRKNSHFNPIR